MSEVATADARLRTLIERIERLEEDKAAVSADIKEVYSEAKGEGYDPKIMKRSSVYVKWLVMPVWKKNLCWSSIRLQSVSINQ